MEKATSTTLKFILERPKDQSSTGGDSGDSEGGSGKISGGDSGRASEGSSSTGTSSSTTSSNTTSGASSSISSTNTTGFQTTSSTNQVTTTSTVAVPNTGENYLVGVENGSETSSVFTPVFVILFLIAVVIVAARVAVKQKKSYWNFSGGVSKLGFRPLRFSLVGSAVLALAFLGFSFIGHSQSEDKVEATSPTISISSLGTVEKEMKDYFDLTDLVYGAQDVVSVTSSSSEYRLFMQATSDKLYLNGDSTASSYFRPVEGSDDWNLGSQDGSWGYHMIQGFEDRCGANPKGADLLDCESVVWDAVPDTATEIGHFSSIRPANGLYTSETEVYFGVNPSDELDNGVYSTKITYTAIADEVPEPETPPQPVVDPPTVMRSMQDVNVGDLPAGETSVISDIRDGQEYTIYRWPTTGTAGTDYPEGMAGYAIMTKDLSLGYVTGGSVTKGADLVLTANDSAEAGTVLGETTSTNSDDGSPIIRYSNGAGGTYDSHSYYTWTAALKVCPKGWRLPRASEYRNIVQYADQLASTDATEGNRLTKSPFNFVYGGMYDAAHGEYGELGTAGVYWSLTSARYEATVGGYRLALAADGNGVSDSGMDGQYFDRLSVRCVAEPAGATLTGPGSSMQNTVVSNLPVNETSVLSDARDEHEYTVYRWPTTGTAGTDYPEGLAGYAIMTMDLNLGNSLSAVYSGDLILTTNDSAGAGTIIARSGVDDWSPDDTDDNLQYIRKNNNYRYIYYSFGAAQKVCPKGWRLPTNIEYDNIAAFMGGNNATGSETIRKSPYAFNKYGDFDVEGGWSDNTYGRYWASTEASHPSRGWSLALNDESVFTGTNEKSVGRLARCIAGP